MQLLGRYGQIATVKIGRRRARPILEGFANAVLVVLSAGVWSGDPTPGQSEFTVEPRDKPSSKALISQRVSIRVDSTLVLIPVTVIDPYDRFVTGREKENFRILEDKKEQDIVHFSSEDAPLSVDVE